MDNRKTDLGKQHKPAEGSRDNLKAELSEEELSKVSGGRLGSACATGEHIKKPSSLVEGRLTSAGPLPRRRVAFVILDLASPSGSPGPIRLG
jgi:bacteriocin-like protein